MTTSHAIVRDHRRITFHRVGEGTSGRTVVFFQAAPGSGDFDPDPRQTAAHDVTLIGIDRPGYGGSDPVGDGRWADVGSAADDAAAVVEELGVGPVDVAGWSAGGRVALALAARRPELVGRAAVVATPAPDEDVPWIPEPQREGLGYLRGLPPEQVHAALGEQLAGVVPADPSSDDSLAMVGDAAVDAGALAMPGMRERLTRMLDAAFAQGATGLAADIAGYTLRPWGFDPAEVKAPTLLVYGADDEIVSRAHGEWWQQRVPGSRLDVVPGAGHLVVGPAWAQVLDHLVASGR